jgi:hypothetical protein
VLSPLEEEKKAFTLWKPKEFFIKNNVLGPMEEAPDDDDLVQGQGVMKTEKVILISELFTGRCTWNALAHSLCAFCSLRFDHSPLSICQHQQQEKRERERERERAMENGICKY